MKVTLPNIARFWKRLMFPPDTDQYRYNRLVLRYDIPWEPWLHAAVWIGTITALVVGERGIMPPINGIDWSWIFFGLLSPTLGFFSVWTLEHYKGRPRYFALWGRMIADAGLATTILLYQLDRYISHDELEAVGLGHGVIPNVVLFFSMWFTLTLVWRDIKFIIATEALAAQIYKDVHYVTVADWVSEWGDDELR